MRPGSGQWIPKASASVTAIRNRIDHPIIDADGHLQEFMPWVHEILCDIAGSDVADRLFGLSFGSCAPGSGRLPVRTFFTVPARNGLDRMTGMLPELMYRRLDEIGLDFALLYPSFGTLLFGAEDDELRQAASRALNTYYARAYNGYRDRLEPVAFIPMFTPEEAVAELEHAVGTLGLKAVVMTGTVPRRVRPDGTVVPWIDTLGHGSVYDYDPVWAACERLGVVPAFHGVGYGWGSRTSPTNYVYNHLGNFASSQEAVCRSLVMGGVLSRFPNLRFIFLEGGVSWACQLLADFIGHFEKRNASAVKQYDPAELDTDLCADLLDTFGAPEARRHRAEMLASMKRAADVTEPDQDDFQTSGISSADDITEMFSRMGFGCEADDKMNSLAFNRNQLPGQRPLNAMFASDIGHWDVPDMREVVPEAWELVADDLIDPADFREFTFGNISRTLCAVNPGFFKGTSVSSAC